MRPIVCQSPRVRPTFEEIAAQFGTSGPGFNPTAVASAFSGDASDVVLPNSGAASGENDGADEVDVLDTLLGPVIREPQPIRLALAAPPAPPLRPPGAGSCPIRSPAPRQPTCPGTGAPHLQRDRNALPGQIAPSTGGPAVQLHHQRQPPTPAHSRHGRPSGAYSVPSPLPRPT
jgi:hypothetical protein